MVALFYLKHAYDESDEGLVERWSETPALPGNTSRAWITLNIVYLVTQVDDLGLNTIELRLE
jgi:hypothetical protein